MADRLSVKSGVSRLAQLLDALISNPVDGQFLRYTASAGKWENAGPFNLVEAGTYSAVGNGVTTAFTVTIPALFGNAPIVVISLNSGSSGFLSTLPTVQVTSNTTFILNFSAAPASGVHFNFNWIAVGT